MIKYLIKIFIKNNDDTGNPKVREHYGVLCGTAGIFLNLLLFSGKLFAGILSSSIAITADAFNNLSDAGSSIITLLGFKLAGRRPDRHHPFGHGRMEYVSGLLVAVLIVIMAIELLRSSFLKILHPEAIESSWLVIAILFVSILVKLYMHLYNKCYGRLINSSAMLATATDSLGDVCATSFVLIATLVSRFTHINIDGWCGLVVGLLILYAGYTTAMETIGTLMGRAPDPDFVDSIEQTVLSHDGIIGVHDLMVHDYGPGRMMISLHAEVPASGNILVMHDLIDNIEMQLRETLNCEATIHMDPVVTDDEETTRLKQRAKELLAAIDTNLKMHDFRVVKGPTHTNLIFDVVVPFRYKMTDLQLKESIADAIMRQMENCRAVVQVDKDFTSKQS